MTILWVTIIFLVTCLPAEKQAAGGLSFFDKFVHFGMFFTLGLLLLNMKREKEIETKRLVYFFLIYALITEMNQLWVPNRSFSLLDLVLNYLGGGAAFVIKW